MKLKSTKGLKSTDTLLQDHRLQTKEFFNLWSESSSLPNANKFLSFHTVQNIHKGVICQAFLRALPTNDPCHPRRVPSLNKRESKTHQRRRKEDPKEPETLHSEEEDDQPSTLQRDKRNTYLPKRTPSFEVGLKLTLSPKMLPKQRRPP